MYNSNENIITSFNNSSILKSTETTKEESYLNDLSEINSENNKINSIIEFLYFTPLQIKKKELLAPSTPRKIISNYPYDKYIIKGRNLTEIFESL